MNTERLIEMRAALRTLMGLAVIAWISTAILLLALYGEASGAAEARARAAVLHGVVEPSGPTSFAPLALVALAVSVGLSWAAHSQSRKIEEAERA